MSTQQRKAPGAAPVAVPWDPEMEQAMLGSILVNNDTFDLVSDTLRAEHFNEPLHQRIYTTIGEVIRSGRTASPMSLRPYFEADEGIKSVGGSTYLAILAQFTPSVINAADFARLIVELTSRSRSRAVSNPSPSPERTRSMATSITRASMISLRLRSSADGSTATASTSGLSVLSTCVLHQNTSVSRSLRRSAKSGYFLIKAQKFFLARHFGQPLPRSRHRATERQYSILSASRHSRICFRQFISRKSSTRARVPRL